MTPFHPQPPLDPPPTQEELDAAKEKKTRADAEDAEAELREQNYWTNNPPTSR